jgi:hypothetical protein
MDKGEFVYKAQQEALEYVRAHPTAFMISSNHRNWGGRLKCGYCRTKGYGPEITGAGEKWWGHKHGVNCKKVHRGWGGFVRPGGISYFGNSVIAGSITSSNINSATIYVNTSSNTVSMYNGSWIQI